MNLLKGITEGLQGRGDTDSASDSDTTSDGERSNRESSPESKSTSASESTTATESDGRDQRDDEHVCDFCDTDFDANRGACPDCGAKIVVRGRR